jgi:hypothetical protein
MRRSDATAAASLACLLGHAALAGGPSVIEQHRWCGGFTIVPQCQGQDFDDAQAKDFGPFVAQVEASNICAMAQGIAAAEHDSEIHAGAMFASGHAASSAVAVMPNAIHAIANSVFEVTFVVMEQIEFSATATLAAESSDNPIVVLSGTTFNLFGPGGADIFEHFVQPGPNGEPVSQQIEESGVLTPGTYTLRAQCATVIDNTVPPAVSAENSFQMSFLLGPQCAGDTDGDGAVDVVDLINVLLAWDTADPQADVNGDGAVDVVDLIEVLLAWGAC